jgi:phosphopantothenate---cysteine ligase (CTP)
MSKLEVIVTSGGTISMLDDVRHIGNFSSGTTGALIAEEFLKSGATVHYVYGSGAKRPFRSSLVVDPDISFDDQIERLKAACSECNLSKERLHEYSIRTFEEYLDTVKTLVTTTNSDVIVLAAAVGDYGGVGKQGKISSDNDVLRLELPKNPKVISLIKEWKPNLFQVGFKLLSRVSIDNLIDTAYQHGIKNHSNLTVANTLQEGSFKNRITVFITPEKGLIPVSIEDLAPKLVEIVNQRASKKHYRTVVNSDAGYLSGMEEETNLFRKYVSKLWNLNLFEPYFGDSSMDFGFVALRVPKGGFLITSRGSNKQEMPLSDIIYVPSVDFAKRTVYANSSGNKPSLNTNVAAAIFAERPDANVIVHAHVFPGIENRTSADYAPSTQEDVDAVLAHLQLKDGHKIVELVNHGIISLGRNLDEIISTLDVEPAYSKFPHFYDAIYHRFQQSTDFADLICQCVKADESVLDLAAGTGEVSRQLKERGYCRLSLADKNAGMLEVARKKLGPEAECHIAVMEQLDLGKSYDAIVLRQAINYLMDYEGLVSGLKAMHSHLNDGGKLIFNAPNPRESSYKQRPMQQYEYGDYNVKVLEMNVVDGSMITHTQQCTLTRKDGLEIRKFYDLNKFGLFTSEEFASAIKEAGFSSAKFLGKAFVELSPGSQTIYCVANK